MIDMKEYETMKVARGQTLRMNHTDCDAGADNRRRLYLTRPAASPDVLLGFCHNCQEHGVLRDGSDEFKDFNVKPVQNEKSVPFAPPVGLVDADVEAWPHDAQVWRISKQLTLEDCTKAGIKYDPASHRVFLPMYDRMAANGMCHSNTNLMGYQLRDISGTNCKYLTALKDKDTKPHTIIGHGTRVTYLVEDLASGLVLQRAFQRNEVFDVVVVVNYGVKCTPEVLSNSVLSNYYVVWLDNDGDHIEDQARIISRTWQLFSGNPTYIEDQYSDPKSVDDGAIMAIDQFWEAEYHG